MLDLEVSESHLHQAINKTLQRLFPRISDNLYRNNIEQKLVMILKGMKYPIIMEMEEKV
jgi:hypothetical protein